MTNLSLTDFEAVTSWYLSSFSNLDRILLGMAKETNGVMLQLETI